MGPPRDDPRSPPPTPSPAADRPSAAPLPSASDAAGDSARDASRVPVHCGGSGAEHATRATCAPPLGMPSHSIAEADDPKQTGGRIPSASTTEGAAASSGFPLDPRSFSVMLTLGPREVLLPVGSSPGWELFTPVQGALLARADPRPRSGTISGYPRPAESAGSHLTAIPQPGLAPVWPR